MEVLDMEITAEEKTQTYMQFFLNTNDKIGEVKRNVETTVDLSFETLIMNNLPSKRQGKLSKTTFKDLESMVKEIHGMLIELCKDVAFLKRKHNASNDNDGNETFDNIEENDNGDKEDVAKDAKNDNERVEKGETNEVANVAQLEYNVDKEKDAVNVSSPTKNAVKPSAIQAEKKIKRKWLVKEVDNQLVPLPKRKVKPPSQYQTIYITEFGSDEAKNKKNGERARDPATDIPNFSLGLTQMFSGKNSKIVFVEFA